MSSTTTTTSTPEKGKQTTDDNSTTTDIVKKVTTSAKREEFMGVTLDKWALGIAGFTLITMVGTMLGPRLGDITKALGNIGQPLGQQQPAATGEQIPAQQQPVYQTPPQQQIDPYQGMEQNAMENGTPVLSHGNGSKAAAATTTTGGSNPNRRYVIDRDPFGNSVKIPVLSRGGESPQHLENISVE